MISLEQLWIPIVLSAVLVFVMSSLIHMVFKWHNSEYRGVANEEELRRVLRAAAPGQYMLPYCADMKDMKKPPRCRRSKLLTDLRPLRHQTRLLDQPLPHGRGSVTR